MTEALHTDWRDVIQHGEAWAVQVGDCEQLLDELPGKSVHHVITDPPYDEEAHTQGRRIKVRGDSRADAGRGVVSAPLAFAPLPPRLRRWVCVMSEHVARRWVMAFCQAESVGDWRDDMEAAGLRWKRALVWIKPDGQPQLSGDRPGVGYEQVAAAHVPGRSRWNGGGRTGVYYATRHQDQKGPRHLRHQTVKPLPLMESLIRDFTDPGDIVLDPFCGSGSTGVACLRLGRRFIGFEREPKYAEIAHRRLRMVREQRQLFNCWVDEQLNAKRREQLEFQADVDKELDDA